MVVANTAITGATNTKITYDAKGLVTSGAAATTADIADSSNARYCTDAQKTVIGNTSGTNSGDVTLATNTGLAFGSGQTLLALGTPSSITTSSTNSVTTNTHTHAISGFATGAGSASGANTVDVTLATNNGLSLSSQQIAMGTPSSITTSSTNSVTTNTHTHAITGFPTGSGTSSGTNTGDVTLATNTGLAFGSGQTLLALGTPSTCTNATSNAVTTNTHTHAVTGLVVANTAITGATNTKITYDAKGLVTSGAAATTADIADSSNARYCTDAQKTVIGNTSGTNSGDVTLAATNHGLGLTNQVITLGTPSTCTNATSNAVTTTTHTHAVSGFATGAGSASGANTVDVTLATNSGLSFGSGQTLLTVGTPTTLDATTTNSVTTNTHAHAVTTGTTASTLCVGNDGRLSDSRAPNGTASGDLAGSYPAPTVAQSSTAFALTGVISPTAIAANTNDYAPTGLSGASFLRLSASAAYNVTGLTGGGVGRILTIHNVGSFAITFTNQDALSTAANRFALTQSMTLSPDECCVLQYDNTTARWRALVDAHGPYGTTANTICQGNDSRLSDDRTASGIRTATTIVATSTNTAPTAGQVMVASSTTAAAWSTVLSSTTPAAIGTAAVGAGTTYARDNHVHNVSTTEVSRNANCTTTSTTPVIIGASGGTQITLTPGAGTYLAMLHLDFYNSSTSSTSTISIYFNGGVDSSSTVTAVTNSTSLRGYTYIPVSTQAIVTVAAGQTIDGRWSVSNGSTGSSNNAALILMKIG